MTEALTPIDIKILEQLQKDATLSTTELAERVGLSQSPCWRRLQRLRDEGYILAMSRCSIERSLAKASISLPL